MAGDLVRDDPKGPKATPGIEVWRDRNGRVAEVIARWRDDAGVQRKKKFTGARCVTDAKAHKSEMESAKRRGVYIDLTNQTTVAEYARQVVASRPYRQGSAQNRDSMIRTHLDTSNLGKMRLVLARRSHVQGWITERVKGSEDQKAVAPSTLRSLLGVVRLIFSTAEADGVIGKSPAAGRFFLPPVKTEKVVPLTAGQVRTLAGYMPDRMRAAVLTQATLGLRIGELLGLQLPDVNFLRREVYIREQLDPNSRGRMDLKTSSSRRDLPLPTTTADILAAHLQQFPAVNGFIFTDGAGRPFQHWQVNDAIDRAAEKAELPHTTSHDFRHSYASILLEAGESVVVVAERLGHSDASMVLRVYGHLMPDSEDRTRQAIDSAWSALDVPSATTNSTEKAAQ